MTKKSNGFRALHNATNRRIARENIQRVYVSGGLLSLNSWLEERVSSIMNHALLNSALDLFNSHENLLSRKLNFPKIYDNMFGIKKQMWQGSGIRRVYFRNEIIANQHRSSCCRCGRAITSKHKVRFESGSCCHLNCWNTYCRGLKIRHEEGAMKVSKELERLQEYNKEMIAESLEEGNK